MTQSDFGHTYGGRIETSSDAEHTRGVLRDEHELFVDEPEWLPVGAGTDEYPSPVDYLGFALAACQVSVLEQALEKARVEAYEIDLDWEIDRRGAEDVPEEMPSNTATRVEHVSIDLTVRVPEEYEPRAKRCLDVYDSGCIVGQSFKRGIDYTPRTTLEITD